MSRYCKAYKLEDLRKFAGWSQSAKNDKDQGDDTIVYITDQFNVTTNPLEMDKEEDFLFDVHSDEWKTFCTDTLKFEIPDLGDEDVDNAAE